MCVGGVDVWREECVCGWCGRVEGGVCVWVCGRVEGGVCVWVCGRVGGVVWMCRGRSVCVDVCGHVTVCTYVCICVGTWVGADSKL